MFCSCALAYKETVTIVVGISPQLFANSNNKLAVGWLYKERLHLKDKRELAGLEGRLKMNSF